MLGLPRVAGVAIMLGAALAVTAAPVLAQTQTYVSGSLSGVEYSVEQGCSPGSTCTASLAGYFTTSSKGYSGLWNVGVKYTLPTSTSTDWYTTTPFMLSTSRGTFTATVSGGTIMADTMQPLSFGFCAQPYNLSGTVTPTSSNWSDVAFTSVVLTDYGIYSGGTCTDIFFATVGGSLSFTAKTN